jgi:hypothetical protein
MTTQRWENVRIGDYVCEQCGTSLGHGPPSNIKICGMCKLSSSRMVIERVVPPMPVEMKQEAIDDLRQQLADTRAERDRYVELLKKREAQLERLREVLK